MKVADIKGKIERLLFNAEVLFGGKMNTSKIPLTVLRSGLLSGLRQLDEIAAEDVKDVPKKYHYDGTVVFRRDTDPDMVERVAHYTTPTPGCVCCPDGRGHVFTRYIDFDHKPEFEPVRLLDLVNKIMYEPGIEGKRIRVTVEVL